MPKTNSYIIKQPPIKGLDLMSEARFTNPGSYKKLANLYAKQPGFITVRPGSKLVSQTTAIAGKDPDKVGSRTPPAGSTKTPWTGALTGLKNAQPAVSTYNGTHPLFGEIIAAGSHVDVGRSIPTFTANTTGSAGTFVSGLARVWHPRLNRAYWVGAIHRPAGDGGDFFFYLNDNDQMEAIPMTGGLVNSTGLDWSFLVMNTNKDVSSNEADMLEGICCLMTNGRGRPLGLYDAEDNDAPFEVAAVHIRTRWADFNSYDMVDIQSWCLYGGQITFGGFGLYNASTDSYKDMGNCVCWSDVDVADGGIKIETIGGQDSIAVADDNANLYFIRIGADRSERIRAVSPIAALIDSQGITGPLAIMTDKQVAIYTNPPPTQGNPSGQNFHIVAMGDMGCCAPKSLARTPKGLVFLATDGLFYLIGLDNTIEPISKNIQKIFKGLPPTHYRRVCAFYDGEYYCVFYPERSADIALKQWQNNGRVRPSHNTLHLYADLRYYRPAPDMGVLWYGPHDGLNISCVAQAREIDDFRIVMGGTGHTIALIQLMREDLQEDPSMSDLSSTTRPTWELISGTFDGQDIHREKLLEVMRLVCKVQEDAEIQIGMRAIGTVQNLGAAYGETVTLTPNGTAADPGILLDGTELWGHEDNFVAAEILPPENLRGRAFEYFMYQERPETSAFPTLSDIELEYSLIVNKPV